MMKAGAAMSPVQDNNAAMIDLLAMAFPRRREPNFAWGNVVSMFSMLPGLRAFWPTSSLDENGDAYDLSAQGRTLTNNNSAAYAWTGLAHHVNLSAVATSYLSRVDEDGLDVLGTESYIVAANRGLTIGGWFRPTLGGTDVGLMSKYVVGGNQRSYLLRKTAADVSYFAVSVDGAAVAAVNVTAIAINAWQFIVGRFTPGAELATFTDGVKATNLVGVPASIFNSNSAFEVGRYNAANYFTGSWALGFLCAAALSDTWIAMLYEHSRSLFG